MDTIPLVGMPGAVRFEIESKHVGDTFAISVLTPDLSALPSLPADLPDRFRVFYLTDADGVFPAAWSALGFGGIGAMDTDKGFEPVIIVGVGYGTDDPSHWMVSRARDLTPPGMPVTEETKLVLGGEVPHGHADRFLRFLEDELDPVIRREFPATDDRAGLYGFSNGGLFSAYALFTRSPLFDRFIIGSPGNTFPDDLLLDYEARCHGAGTRLDATAYITCGSLERTSLSPGLRFIPVAYDKLIARLKERDYDGFSFTCREYEGESHVSSMCPCLADGLAILYPRAGAGMMLPGWGEPDQEG